MGRGDLAYEMYSKICPPKRGMDPDLYYAEPYVMPGNSDGPESPYFGRAGWTWYTGAAGWLFRVSTEWILGVRPTRRGLQVDPCIPSRWDGFRMVRPFRGTIYQIVVENPRHVSRGVQALWLDGKPLREPLLPDLRDGQVHQVRAILGGRKRT
jgi:cellobiose phosphorylase